MSALYPLRFRPILRRYIWGGRRLETVLGKALGPGDDYAESWELCDLDSDQSVVQAGPLAGLTLGQLRAARGTELLGRHHPRPRFPLLLKFLDASKRLSVQVHPDDAQAARRTPPGLGKTEAWVVLATEPGSTIWAGLKPAVDRQALADSLQQGTCEELLHGFQPAVGDCVFLPAGTVHTLGEGLLVYEIQQASDTTYRLYDWGRVDASGKPRPLHIAEALEAIDFDRGPVGPQQPQPTELPWVKRLVACDRFVLDRWELDSPQWLGGEGRCQIVTVLAGEIQVEGDPTGSAIPRGRTIVLPASVGRRLLTPQPVAALLVAYLP